MSIATYPNGNIGDYKIVSGVVADVSGDYSTTSGTISDYPVVSGDYSTLSGSVADYPVHSGSVANPHHIRLDQIEDPTSQNEINMGNNHLHFIFDAPTVGQHSGAFSIEGKGGFSGPLLFISQNTGNPAHTDLVQIWTDDPDIHGMNVEAASSAATGIRIATGVLCMNNQGRICMMADPVNDYDATTKNWVLTHMVTGIEFDDLSGDYVITSGTVDSYAAHIASSIAHHDPSGYETISGDYLTTSGTVSDYIEVSGDFSTLSGDWGDFDKSGGGANHITGLSGGAWSVFYSEADEVITGIALGLSGLVFSSMGVDQTPVWAAKSAGGGDDLGSHVATLILDMSSKRITGLADPVDNNDATNKKWVIDLTSGVSGLFDTLSGDYSTTSGTIQDYIVVSGAYADLSGDYLTTSGTVDGYAAHVASETSHHDPSGLLTVSGDWETFGYNIDSLSGSTNWQVFYTDGSQLVGGLTLGASGFALMSEGATSAPVFAAIPGGSSIDPTGYETVSGDYIITSGTIDDYAAVSGDYATTSGTVDSYAAHLADNNAHHEPTAINDTPTDTETTTGASSNWAYDHTQNPTDLNHITDAQVGALHSIYTLEVHDNTEHDPDYLANIVEDTTPQLGASLDLNDFGITHELTAAESLVNADLCYMNGVGKMAKADADAEATCDTLLAMCLDTIAADGIGTFLLFGKFITTSLTAGAEYWVSQTSAAITTTKPTATTTIVRHVGTAVSTTVLFFNPSHTYLENT